MTTKTTQPLLECHKKQVPQQKVGKKAILRDSTFEKEFRRINTVCREYTLPRSNPNSESVCAWKVNVRIRPVLDTKTLNLSGLYSLEVLIPSKQNPRACSWVLISSSLNQYASQILDLEQFVAGGTDNIPTCDEKSHSEETPCASNEHTDQIPRWKDSQTEEILREYNRSAITKCPKKAGHN